MNIQACCWARFGAQGAFELEVLLDLRAFVFDLHRGSAWWTSDNAEAMIALRINRANGQWNAYWQNTFKQAA